MKIYRGRNESEPGSPAWGGTVVTVWQSGGVVALEHAELGTVALPGGRFEQLLGPLPHIVKHSPTGFSWGYAGSGPSELARCLLIDHLGPGAVCPDCKGTGLSVQGDADLALHSGMTRVCAGCHGECYTIAPPLYQRFKFDRVAKWPLSGWEITGDEIDEWLAFDQIRTVAQ